MTSPSVFIAHRGVVIFLTAVSIIYAVRHLTLVKWVSGNFSIKCDKKGKRRQCSEKILWIFIIGIHSLSYFFVLSFVFKLLLNLNKLIDLKKKFCSQKL